MRIRQSKSLAALASRPAKILLPLPTTPRLKKSTSPSLDCRPQVWPAAQAALAVHVPPPPVQSDSEEQ